MHRQETHPTTADVPVRGIETPNISGRDPDQSPLAASSGILRTQAFPGQL